MSCSRRLCRVIFSNILLNMYLDFNRPHLCGQNIINFALIFLNLCFDYEWLISEWFALERLERVVETSVTVNNNSPIQDYVHPDDQTQTTFEITPWFKPFTD